MSFKHFIFAFIIAWGEMDQAKFLQDKYYDLKHDLRERARQVLLFVFCSGLLN